MWRLPAAAAVSSSAAVAAVVSPGTDRAVLCHPASRSAGYRRVTRAYVAGGTDRSSAASLPPPPIASYRRSSARALVAAADTSLAPARHTSLRLRHVNARHVRDAARAVPRGIP